MVSESTSILGMTGEIRTVEEEHSKREDPRSGGAEQFIKGIHLYIPFAEIAARAEEAKRNCCKLNEWWFDN
jgi:hypothetical protein